MAHSASVTTVRPAEVGMTVHVLVIEGPHGDTVTLFTSTEKAEEAVYKYVEQWWENEDLHNEYGPLPKDRTEAIDAYFDAVEDEHYSITEAVVEA